jgi:hypothetical protein
MIFVIWMIMGYVYDELIPPAILLDNPGLTRKEFIDAMAETHSGGGEYGKEEPWESGGEFNRFHYGLEGFVKLMGLKERPEYLDFRKGRLDESGLYLGPPSLTIVDPENSHYQVGIHESNRLGRPRKLCFNSFYRYKVGDTLTGYSYGVDFVGIKNEGRIVESVISKIVDEDIIEEDYFKYDVRARTIRQVLKREDYADVQSLLEKWPQFHPEYRWDFSPEKGIFDIDIGSGNFRWMMKDGKYYLDPITFDLIPAGFGVPYASIDGNGFDDREKQKREEQDPQFGLGFGYTDLFLTAEAIRQGAWKLLSYRGHQHAEDFLEDFPESCGRVHKAMWDAHSSLAAKRRNMTTTELLRMQLVGGIT